VRVLNHAASGDSAALALAPGKLDDACAGVTWRAFAGDITDDYATARLNATQLNDLIQSVKDIHDAKPEPAQ
jgi:NAD(P)H-hydrate repair Nnr-like enzyme with NAD(P)H-hydrate dehydratase domain